MSKEMQQKRQIQIWEKQAIEGTLSDELNPTLMFNTINSELLLMIYEGKLDAKILIKNELHKRRLIK
jgi:hypothetical protein